MQPEAARLVSRIRTALKGESAGQETAILAWQYTAAVKKANTRLAKALKAIETDDLLSAYLEEQKSPALLDTCDDLNFSELQQWKDHCAHVECESPPVLNLDKVSDLRQKIEKIDNPKNWLYGEYRDRLRTKQTLSAYPIIKIIAQNFPDDSNASTEHERLRDQLTLEAESSLKKAVEELIPEESPSTAYKRYYDAGLEMPDDKEPFSIASAATLSAKVQKASSKASDAIEASKDIESENLWKAAEEIYFDCDYYLTTSGTRAHIQAELRNEFEKAGNAISHKRSAFEAIIRIQKCISDVNASLEKKKTRSTNATGTFTYSLHDAVERLRSSESQAKRLGNQIPLELQTEIASTLSRAKRSKAPLFIGISIAACLAIGIGFWTLNTLNQRAAEQQARDTAYVAVMDAQTGLSFREAQKALQSHQTAIDTAEETSDLAKQAKALATWIAQQELLDTDFESIADRLESQPLDSFKDKDLAEVERLLNGASLARESLASDLGTETQSRIEKIIQQIEQNNKRRDEQIKRQIEIFVSQTERRVDTAVSSKTKKEFISEAEKAEEKIAQLESMVAANRTIPGVENTQANIQAARANLVQAENKWNALASTFAKLDSATELEEYFKELKRIQSFDILPAKQKTEISRVTKDKPSLEALKQKVIIPNDLEGWNAFTDTEDYRKEEPTVSDVERVFLERLANDTLFETIYQSKVKYFEGSTVARSEYTIYLFDPVSKVETGLKTGINYTFKVRGFDESGEPEPEAREMNFLSHPDGSFWGFFYEPSTVSDESHYYEKTIRKALFEVLAGAPRFTIINLIDEINEERTLASSFRAYWQQQLFTFMKMNPWKWGLPLSPSLQVQMEELSKITEGPVSKRQWLSSIEQTSPSYDLNEYMRLSSKKDLVKEAQAFATMYQFAVLGDYTLAGYIRGDGELITINGFENYQLWAANSLTGNYEPLEEQNAPAPYSPLLTYQFEGKPSEHILQKTLFITGTNLSDKNFTNHLPPLLKDTP